MSDRTAGSGALVEFDRTYAPHEAVLEASRCLMCEDPPCNRGCPAGVDARRFIRKIRFGNFLGASRLVREANLLVGVCGRLCPQEILCMEHCTRAELDTPIDIAGLQRFAGDVELGTLAPLPEVADERSQRVAVLGSGPGGLAAAVELRKAGYQVDVLERSGTPGGLLTRGVPPFRLERSFAESELEYAKRLGANVLPGRGDEDPARLLRSGYDAVLVAVGLWKPYTIGLPGEDLEGVHVAGDILAVVADGGRPDLGRRVVVIGGGNVAIDAATTALRLGAERVDLCCLESHDEMPAFRSEIETAQAEGVEFHTRTIPVAITGEGGKVVGYEGIGIRWKEPGLLVPSNAERIPGTEFRLGADAVIEAIGQGVADRYEGVETDERGLVAAEPETMATSRAGVFACGDVTSGGATVVQAVAEGKRAAEGIDRYLRSLGDSASGGGDGR
jgi:NADPH-dependent glutamate synthase beta subunit-like oxidoreductase